MIRLTEAHAVGFCFALASYMYHSHFHQQESGPGNHLCDLWVDYTIIAALDTASCATRTSQIVQDIKGDDMFINIFFSD